jgi:hypothetical protein
MSRSDVGMDGSKRSPRVEITKSLLEFGVNGIIAPELVRIIEKVKLVAKSSS